MDKVKDTAKNHPNSVQSSVLMSFIVLVFLSTIILFAIIIMDVNDYYRDTTNYVFNAQTNAILSIKTELEKNIEEPLQAITQEMENEIKSMDLDKLESQLNNGEIPKELSNIFDKYYGELYLTGIESDDNDIFVCTSEGIIFDNNIQYATETDERDWSLEVNRQYNKAMADKTITNLLNENSDTSFLVFERKNEIDTPHNIYDEINAETIKEIVSSEGLKGLKNYTFLVPVYITETGDIFGKDDVIAGHLQKTNKFIVVQEYNLYDYIIMNHSIDDYMDTTVIEKDYMRLDTLLKVFAISDIVAILCTIIFSATLSNNLFDSNERNAKLIGEFEEKKNGESADEE